MSKPRDLSEANRLNELYRRADEEWSRGHLRPAFRLFLAAAEGGFHHAFRIVGQFYDHGDGIKANENAALCWYRRAWRSERDSSVATNIGCILRDRGRLNLALRWLRRAVREEDGDANLQIAKIYMQQKRSLKKAIRYLKETCKAKYATKGSKEEARDLLRKMKGTDPKHALSKRPRRAARGTMGHRIAC